MDVPVKNKKQKPYRFKAFAGQMTFLDKFKVLAHFSIRKVDIYASEAYSE